MSKVIVQLFQVKQEHTRDYGFLRLGVRGLLLNGEDGNSKKRAIDMSVYQVEYIADVYDGWVAGHYDMKKGFEESDFAGLEAMFRQFNVEVDLYVKYGSWKFKGRSMSVGDIVSVERVGRGSEPVYYYCDSAGFQQVHVKNIPLPFHVGMGVTRHVGSDCYPYFITRISESGKTFWAKAADTQPDTEGGHDWFTSQKWIVTPSDAGEEQMVRKHKNGSWYMDGLHVSIGHARYYQDPHF